MKRLKTTVLVLVSMFAIDAIAARANSHSPSPIAEPCNEILHAGTQTPPAAFRAIFADYAPIELKHVPYKMKMIEAPDAQAANEWKKQARSAIQVFTRLSVGERQLAFLIKNKDGEYQVLIGSPSVQSDELTRIVPEPVTNVNEHETHVTFEGRFPTTLTVTASNGRSTTVPYDSVVAYTSQELSLFDREFPVGYVGPEWQWQSTSFIQSLYLKSRNGKPGEPALQNSIDTYLDWLDSIFRRGELMAVQLNTPRGVKLVVATVQPVMGSINGYKAVIAIRIKTRDNHTSEWPVAPNDNMFGVVKMTNDTIGKLTKKSVAEIEREFNRTNTSTK